MILWMFSFESVGLILKINGKINVNIYVSFVKHHLYKHRLTWHNFCSEQQPRLLNALNSFKNYIGDVWWDALTSRFKSHSEIWKNNRRQSEGIKPKFCNISWEKILKINGKITVQETCYFLWKTVSWSWCQ